MTPNALDLLLAGAGQGTVVEFGPAPPPRAVVVARAEAAGWDVMVVDGRSVVDKDTALRAVAEAGDFPDWFGGNLDALADSLGDLSWRPAGPHLLVWTHADRLGLVDDGSASAIREILDEVAAAGTVGVVLLSPGRPLQSGTPARARDHGQPWMTAGKNTPVSTLVSFHAHPDDEAIAMGGTIARAVADGHRVVLVFATRGELGEVADGVLAEGESLGDRRSLEVERSAEALGVHRVVFLGYRDSGMAGEPTNDDPGCFWQAPVEEAAHHLSLVLREEQASVLTIYDDHGGYGHPDHVNVHRVGVAVSTIAETPVVYEATMNRDHILESIRMAREAGAMSEGEGPDVDGFDDTFGSPDSIITTRVDVTAWVDHKRASMRAHASQITDESIFLQLPDEQFVRLFGHEWFIRRGVPAHHRETWLSLD